MKIKKVLLAMSMISVMAVGAMALSAFTTSKHDAKGGDCSPWKIFRENVAYCNGDTDMCEGRDGVVWVNVDTYQVAISLSSSTNCNCTRYDLTQSTKKDGYNMRFWHGNPGHYSYVYINIPESAYRQ